MLASRNTRYFPSVPPRGSALHRSWCAAPVLTNADTALTPFCLQRPVEQPHAPISCDASWLRMDVGWSQRHCYRRAASACWSHRFLLGIPVDGQLGGQKNQGRRERYP
jgi:hypothetical protein